MAEHSNEPDADRARQIAEDGLILRTTVGSVVHGLNNPGAPSGPGDLDLTVYGLRRYCHLALKGSRRAFFGYLEAQRRGLLEKHATRTRELSGEHGYDTKYAMHALRIGHQGIELLETGRISLPVPEPTRSALRAVRAGEVPLDGVLEQLAEVTERLERTTASADVPDEPDTSVVNDYLVATYRAAWA